MVNSVSIGNLSPEEDYDKELSRSAILAKRAENDKKEAELAREKYEKEAELALEKAKNEAELAKIEAEKQQAMSEQYSAGFLTKALIDKWDGHFDTNSPIEELFKKYINEQLKEPESEG